MDVGSGWQAALQAGLLAVLGDGSEVPHSVWGAPYCLGVRQSSLSAHTCLLPASLSAAGSAQSCIGKSLAAALSR